MKPVRLQQKELEFTSDSPYDSLALWNSKPFTGIVYDLTDSGNLWSEMSYVNGLQNGVTMEWSDSGILIAEEHWRRGYRHGLNQEWFEDGKLKYEAEFEFNFIVTKKLWDKDGNLIHTYQISDKESSYKVLLAIRKRHRDSSD